MSGRREKYLAQEAKFLRKSLVKGNRNRKPAGLKLSPGGNALDKLIPGYQAVYGSQSDEDAIFSKCKNAISFVEKVDKDVPSDFRLGHINMKELYAILRDCIEQLAAVKSAKIKPCISLAGGSSRAGVQVGPSPRSTALTYTRQVPLAEKSGSMEDTKSAEAAVAAKPAVSSSSAQMLTYFLSSLASEGVITNPIRDSSGEYPSEKRAKIENEYQHYISQNSQPPAPTTSQELNPEEPPPPPSPLPPPVTPPYASAGPPAVGVSPFASPSNAYQNYTQESGFYSQPSSLPMIHMSRQ